MASTDETSGDRREEPESGSATAPTEGPSAVPRTGSPGRTSTDAPVGTSAGRASGGGVLIATLLGGVLAGGIGYLAAFYTQFGLFADQVDPAEAIAEQLDVQVARIDQIESDLGAAVAPDVEGDLVALREEVAAVSDRLDAAGAAGPNEAGIREELTATLDQRTAELSGAIEELRGSMGDMGSGPGSEEISALRQQIETLTDRVAAQDETLAAQADAIETARQAAQLEARSIAAQSAVAEIQAALSTGASYSDAVAALQEVDQDVPDPVSGPAETGVATLAELQDDFDDASRWALSAAVAQTAGGGLLNRFGAFVQAQTNARSLDEREGSGPDAILSRAEARLREGDLSAALSELEALPEDGRSAMSDWLDRARARAGVSDALPRLSQSISQN